MTEKVWLDLKKKKGLAFSPTSNIILQSEKPVCTAGKMAAKKLR